MVFGGESFYDSVGEPPKLREMSQIAEAMSTKEEKPATGEAKEKEGRGATGQPEDAPISAPARASSKSEALDLHEKPGDIDPSKISTYRQTSQSDTSRKPAPRTRTRTSRKGNRKMTPVEAPKALVRHVALNKQPLRDDDAGSVADRIADCPQQLRVAVPS
ncbi:hypothetical protein FRB94_006550 [Tulasnella sp. JGI-2019a]|nr:hypothetical protein FRB94_006550 [Tulasnella sp. JGI-2019a]KAG9036357.1 hypothetical protein FRB95_009279 [Tulasnella sp. JGI-2019a]